MYRCQGLPRGVTLRAVTQKPPPRERAHGPLCLQTLSWNPALREPASECYVTIPKASSISSRLRQAALPRLLDNRHEKLLAH